MNYITARRAAKGVRGKAEAVGGLRRKQKAPLREPAASCIQIPKKTKQIWYQRKLLRELTRENY